MQESKRATLAPDGAVELTLTAVERTVVVDGRPVRLFTYDGQVPGPTIELWERDRVRLRFENLLSEPTNLHLHGMHIPPEVDDPHRLVAPGASTVYEFEVPEGASGTYWYHPHVHGEVAWQLGSGLAGALVVRGPEELLEPLLSCEEKVLVLQDLALDGEQVRPRSVLELHDGREGELILVSGEVTPRFQVSTGLLRLRLVNASSARYYDVRLDGADSWLLGLDAALLEAPVPLQDLLLPPGQRADVLISATQPGPIVLSQRPYDRGVSRLPGKRRRSLPQDGRLATFEVQGEPREVGLPTDLRRVEALDPRRAVTTRVFEYGGEGNMLRFVLELVRGKTYGPGEGARGPVRFWLNGREFEPSRVDVEAELGTSEIWELRNPTPLDHPFHLHIHPFQVLDVDGVPPAFRAWQDVVNVRAGQTVRILIPFRDFAGMTMFHCHILEHEDNGMMGHLMVSDPSALEERTHSC